jgi:hypothetical protein
MLLVVPEPHPYAMCVDSGTVLSAPTRIRTTLRRVKIFDLGGLLVCQRNVYSIGIREKMYLGLLEYRVRRMEQFSKLSTCHTAITLLVGSHVAFPWYWRCQPSESMGKEVRDSKDCQSVVHSTTTCLLLVRSLPVAANP